MFQAYLGKYFCGSKHLLLQVVRSFETERGLGLGDQGMVVLNKIN